MKDLPPLQPIGFIGTGVMGASMAAHLQKAGYPLIIYNRTREKAESLLKAGAIWAESPAEVARQTRIIFTIVGFPQDVEKTYLGEQGLIPNGQAGSIYCDCTTSSPSIAGRIAEAGFRRRIDVLDAPVSGGDVGARNGTLSIMCGGDLEAFQTLEPLLHLMGENVIYQGLAGSGQHTKMCNQIAIAGTMLGVCEALRYAETSGLDPRRVLQSIATGAAGSWTLSNLAPRILDENFEPGFYVEHYIKDLDIALKEATRLGLNTPALKKARDMFEIVRSLGGNRKGTQALYWAYKRAADGID